MKVDTHRERDDACLPFAESASITGSLGLEEPSTKGGDTGLASKASVNAAAGASHRLGANVRDEAGAFLDDVRDPITPEDSGATNPCLDVGKARMAGLETVLEVTQLPGLTLRADDTFADGKERTAVRVTDDVTNVRRHKAGVLASRAAARTATRVDLDLAWLGSTYSTFASVACPNDPVRKTTAASSSAGR